MGKITVHCSCRRRSVDHSGGDKAYEPPRKSLHLSVDETAEKHYFDWKACFICGKTADRQYSTVIPVRTTPLHDTLIKRCDERNDEWGEEVRSRLITCTDLVAEEAIYHCECMTKFRLTILSSNKLGRPINAVMMDNFERVCNWLEEESDCELYLIAEFHEKMVQSSEGSICYSKKSLKRKLIEGFRDHIFFEHQPGLPNIICFKHYVWFIMSELKKIQSQTHLDIITAAAKIIKNDIRVMPCDKKEYPDISGMQDIEYTMTWTPESLSTFLSHLVSSPLKQPALDRLSLKIQDHDL